MKITVKNKKDYFKEIYQTNKSTMNSGVGQTRVLFTIVYHRRVVLPVAERYSGTSRTDCQGQ